MDEDMIMEHAEKFLGAWNTQVVEAVLGCYTEDVFYTDPNTRGAINGHEPLGRYLKKLFDNWTMTWALREAHPLEDGFGYAALWHATFKKPDGDKIVEADGMDLVIVRGDRISRNEVYFDRAALASLM